MFDKTETMTKGVFKVVGLHHCKISEEELFRLVAHVEYFSNHPIAKSIVRHYGKDVDVNIVKDLKEIGGRGLSGIVDGKKLLIGNDKLMDENNIEYIDCRDVGTVVHVAINNSYEGHIFIDDVIKENAKNSIQLLKKYGAKKIMMLTGDRENISKNVASNIGIDEYHSNLLPDGKLKYVENEMKKYRVSFVGDGINDVPCITKSDVGIVMDEKGADVAIDLADVVIMDDDIMSLPKAYKMSKMIMLVVLTNIIFSIGFKILILVLSMFGITNMWLAIFSDVGIMILAVLNSMRLLIMRIKM